MRLGFTPQEGERVWDPENQGGQDGTNVGRNEGAF